MAVKKDEERVALTIPKIPGTSNDDVIIGLNGKVYQIRRGVEVMVPPGVAAIYDESVKFTEEAEERAEKARAKIGG